MSQLQSEQSPPEPFSKGPSLKAPSKFHQLETRVKIKSDTYIQFDGTDHVYLKNVVSEDAIRIKYDILLILYDIVTWSTIGDLIEPWPPDDQLKIMDTLEKLYEGKVILVDDQGETEVSGENKLPDTLGNHIHINVENHHAMLRDYVRLAAYRRAIEHSVNHETVAMDLGCGSGILSFFLAQAGAKKIYAIEKRPDIILLAEELAKNNGYDQIQFCSGTSSQMDASQFDPKPSVLVSEILGNGILEENVLEFT
ncbi:MAG: methyltransferase domain-containing protein [Cyanobacteria bacterium]|nr:methyltransferase domain-containing protein [Cyanobacteriota bacterium]